MKRFKLLLVALATVSFTAFYACGGANDEETNNDSLTEEVVTEPEVIEQTTPDSTEMATPDSTMTDETEETK
ncbi:MAG: hypothetical protein HC831_02990 [Chloroflexia bacterium]|nr:hypothetical protein [Chloroflexia bacterium]